MNKKYRIVQLDHQPIYRIQRWHETLFSRGKWKFATEETYAGTFKIQCGSYFEAAKRLAQLHKDDALAEAWGEGNWREVVK